MHGGLTKGRLELMRVLCDMGCEWFGLRTQSPCHALNLSKLVSNRKALPDLVALLKVMSLVFSISVGHVGTMTHPWRRLHCTYDNPSSAMLKWGEDRYDEMCVVNMCLGIHHTIVRTLTPTNILVTLSLSRAGRENKLKPQNHTVS